MTTLFSAIAPKHHIYDHGVDPDTDNQTSSTLSVLLQFDEWIKPTICDNHSDPKPDFCDPSPCSSSEDSVEVELRTDANGGETAYGMQERRSSGRGWDTIYGPFGTFQGNGAPLESNTLYTDQTCVPKNKW